MKDTATDEELKHQTGLSADKLSAIRDIIGADPRVKQIVLFGSRAEGAWREGSDIDSAVLGEGIGPGDASRWADSLEEALFPWSVDVVLLNDSTDTALREHIERVGVVMPVTAGS